MENESSEHLSIVADARSAVADRLITPWWYHPILGALCASYLVALSLGSSGVRLVGIMVFGLGCGLLVRAYRDLTGVWVSGTDAGPAARWSLALVGVLVVALLTSWSTAYWADLAWPTWVLAVVVFVATVVLGRRFDSALRAHLRASTA